MKRATASSFSRGPIACAVDLLDRREQQRPALGEELVEHLVLGLEVVVDEPVGDPRLVGDVGDAAVVEALAGEDVDRRVEDLAALVDRRGLGAHERSHQACTSVGPAVGCRAAVGERRQRAADPVLALEVELGGDEALLVGRLRQDDAPGVDDHRAAVGAVVRRRVADLVGGDHEDLVLDRPRAQQDLPVVLAGRAA